ncbi:MAG: hypothetical protein K2V38_00200 [Gemmataceae bacterium]|nr:hypothetical protein [Gemmataceae bacterium]
MSKLLRKYQTWIMVIGGVLLMVAFLVPSAVQELGRAQGSRSVYKLNDGTSINQLEYQKSNRILGTLRGAVPAAVGFLRIDSKDSAQWILQSHLAKKAGFIAPKGDGADSQFIDLMATEEVVGALQARYGEQWQLFAQYQREEVETTRKEVARRLEPATRGVIVNDVRMDESLAEFRGVRRMREAFLSIPRLSPARVMASAKKLLDAAGVDYITLSVDDQKLADITEPSAEQIAAHYEKYKGVSKGDGDYGFGFTLPARAAVAWLTIDRAAVQSAVKLDPVEVQARLLAQPADVGDARTRKQQVEEALRREITDRAMRAAADRVKNEILLATSKLQDRPASTLKLLPPTGVGISLTDLGVVAAKAASDVTGAPMPAFTQASTQLLTAQGLEGVPGLGRAAMRQGSGTVPAVLIFMNTDGLPSIGNSPIVPQVGLPIASSFDDQSGNMLFVMVTQVRAPGPPTNLDEVRDEVILDLKRLTALQLIERDIDVLTAQAREVSLEDVQLSQKAKGARVSELRKDARISRGRAQVQDPGVDVEVFREAVMSRADKLDPTLPVDRRDPSLTFSVTLPKTFSVAIAQIHTYEPLTLERYRALAPQARNQLLFTEIGAGMDEPFTTSALAKRYGVDLKSRGEE